MGILRSILGPSKDEIWSQIADDIGGEFIDGGFWGDDVLDYRHGEWQILLDTYTFVTEKGRSSTYTRMRAPFVNRDGLYFKVYRGNVLSSIFGKIFGMQGIEIGDPFFDDQFVIRGNSTDKIGLLLSDEKIKTLIRRQPDVHFAIRRDEDWLRAASPEGVDELYFECKGVIKETELLKSLFELFSITLMRLVQIDSAYENDPNVKLK